MSHHNFIIQKRGHRKILLLVPGWAFDRQIFVNLDLDYDYILSEIIDTEYFVKDLLAFLTNKSIEKIEILAWSMGGYLALDFVQKYPQFVNKLSLVSVGHEFTEHKINEQKLLLSKDKHDYLFNFYRNCFIGQKNAFELFKKKLLQEYILKFEEKILQSGLDYLAACNSLPNKLNKCSTRKRIKLFLSTGDRIIDTKKTFELCRNLIKIQLIKKSGHLLFFDPNFKFLFTRSRIDYE